MPDLPPDFGGFIAGWEALEPRAFLVRCGQGKPIEGVALTPLNILQAHKTLGALIDEGRERGFITDEHVRQSEQLPHARGLDNVMPRENVDEIAGPG